jgi:sacsin
VLDTSTHPDSPLLVDGLSEYQGPALLAYNDALFTERDFDSLASLGDSKKIQDKAATGKFGLGFSSVWPWIVDFLFIRHEPPFTDQPVGL